MAYSTHLDKANLEEKKYEEKVVQVSRVSKNFQVVCRRGVKAT